MNSFFSFLFWLAGVLQLISMIGGMIVWIILAWMVFTRRGWHALQQLWEMPEYRCWSCSHHARCKAADTGVIYPCQWYKEKDKP